MVIHPHNQLYKKKKFKLLLLKTLTYKRINLNKQQTFKFVSHAIKMPTNVYRVYT